MDIYVLIAAFGGGVIGAYMGALPAFIMTGFVTIAGAVVLLAGGPDQAVNFIAFGSYLGPHVAFAGGVAAAAYAAKKEKLSSGTDLATSLNGIQDPMTLVVGGVFGVLGYLFLYLYGSVFKFNTDLPGLVVITSGIIVRYLFGTTGFTGKVAEGETKKYISDSNGLMCNVLLGLGVGTAVSFVYAALANAGVDPALLGAFPSVCFGISAASLIFAQTGSATPATHHIALIGSLAAVLSGSPVMGVVFAVIAAVMGDFFGHTVNSDCDTHIDPPAFTIFILTFVINGLFGAGIFLV